MRFLLVASRWQSYRSCSVLGWHQIRLFLMMTDVRQLRNCMRCMSGKTGRMHLQVKQQMRDSYSCHLLRIVMRFRLLASRLHSYPSGVLCQSMCPSSKVALLSHKINVLAEAAFQEILPSMD